MGDSEEWLQKELELVQYSILVGKRAEEAEKLLPILSQSVKSDAMSWKTIHDGFVECGFSEAQAFEIVKIKMQLGALQSLFSALGGVVGGASGR